MRTGQIVSWKSSGEKSVIMTVARKISSTGARAITQACRGSFYLVIAVALTGIFVRPALADSGEEARALSQQALILIKASKFADATALAQKGLTLCNDAGAFMRYCVGVFNELLGDAASAQSQYPDALAYYEKSLQARQTQLGPDDRLVGITQYKIGHTHAALRHNHEAEAAFKDAAANFEKRAPVERELGATLFELEKIYMASERFDEAVIAARRALDVYIAVEGHDGKMVPIMQQVLSAALISVGRSQDEARPPVGGVSSPRGAMIFYLAHGQVGTCGPDCSEWVAAEGVVEWDTFKRLFAFMEHLGQRKVPVVLNVWGEGNLNVATTLGKIIRDHGLDASAGTTIVAGCEKAAEAECFALKRSGKPLDARIDISFVQCDVVCVLMLAGGVRRTLPAGAKVIIGPTQIRNRLAPNVSAERQQGLQARYGDQYKLYLTQMGVRTEVVEIIDRNSETGHATQLLRADWLRLGIVTGLAP
jgi:hypothetical protein